LNSPYAVDSDECEPCDSKKYASLIGSLMYLANFTRPDIVFSVNQLCRYISEPSVAHWKAALHVVSYLHGTHDFGLLYKPNHASCIGFCDASHASDIDTMRSVSGYCFSLNHALISWQSKMQSTVALSTAEAEYMAMCSAGKEGIWLSRLLQEMQSPVVPMELHVGENVPRQMVVKSKSAADIQNAQLIFSDSMSALAMVQNNQSSKQTKHIAKVHHWAREQVEAGTLKFQHVKGNMNVADAFTKYLPKDAFIKYRNLMGLVSLKDIHSSNVA
jgi:hypothetical protein